MITSSIIIAFVVCMIIMVVLVVLFFKLQYGHADLEAAITGIWANRDDSIRILIYNLNSKVQAEVVWTDSQNENILGKTIISDMNLSTFGWSKGMYIDPLTHDKFTLRLKLKSESRLALRVDNPGHRHSDQWRLVK